MCAYTDVFKRKEIKYRLDAEQFARCHAMLEDRMSVDQYGRSMVSSLYFDTPERSLICRSLEKPLYKEKLRLRTYGKPVEVNGETTAFLEIKKKFKGVVYKRRVRVTSAAAMAFIGGMAYEDAVAGFPLHDAESQASALSARSLQIASELENFFGFYAPLEPSMRIDVMRSALTEVDNPESDLRITFDECVSYTDMSERSSRPKSLLEPGGVIMEIKSCGAMPLWLVRILNECVIRPSSFSKYGESYKASLRAS